MRLNCLSVSSNQTHASRSKWFVGSAHSKSGWEAFTLTGQKARPKLLREQRD